MLVQMSYPFSYSLSYVLVEYYLKQFFSLKMGNISIYMQHHNQHIYNINHKHFINPIHFIKLYSLNPKAKTFNNILIRVCNISLSVY